MWMAPGQRESLPCAPSWPGCREPQNPWPPSPCRTIACTEAREGTALSTRPSLSGGGACGERSGIIPATVDSFKVAERTVNIRNLPGNHPPKHGTARGQWGAQHSTLVSKPPASTSHCGRRGLRGRNGQAGAVPWLLLGAEVKGAFQCEAAKRRLEIQRFVCRGGRQAAVHSQRPGPAWAPALPLSLQQPRREQRSAFSCPCGHMHMSLRDTAATLRHGMKASC